MKKNPPKIGWTREQLNSRGFQEQKDGSWKAVGEDVINRVSKSIAALPQELFTNTERKSKYGNKKTIISGHKFDSIKESKRYLILKDMEDKGEISNLKLQHKFIIEIDGNKICTYIADFTYFDQKQTYIVEDVKGMKTAVYNLKKKLMKAILNISIKEI